ncbi:telomeric repeat-binding factor 2-interacting protein 1-like isoform X4 [Pomacea canaliculata]|nr:telomeric repeat-binding factor 2-interacting protein 1-like isoform X4 [Pomacea canaliculata]
MTDSETDSDMSPPTTIKMPHGKRGRAPFSIAEDLKILQYVVENRVIDKTGGKAIWKQMESLKLTKHSGESMRSRFLKKIMNTLDIYDIPNQWKSYLTGNTAVAAIDSEKTDLSDNTAKDSTAYIENTDAEAREDETGVVEETPEMRSGSGSVTLHGSDQGSQTSISNAVLSACSPNNTNSTLDDLHHSREVDLESEEYDDFDMSLLQMAKTSSIGSTTEPSGLSTKSNSMEDVSEKQDGPVKSHSEITKAKERSQVSKDATSAIPSSFDDSDFIFDSEQTESPNLQKKQSEERPQNRLKRRTTRTSLSQRHVQADVSTQKKSLDKNENMAADLQGQHKYHFALQTRSGIVSQQNGRANGRSSRKKHQKKGAPSSQIVQNSPKRKSRKKKKDDDESESNCSDAEEKSASAASKGSSEKQLKIILSSSECEKLITAKSPSVAQSSPKRNLQPSAACTLTTPPRRCSRLSLSSSKVLPGLSPQKEGSGTSLGGQRSKPTSPSDPKMRKRKGSHNQSVSTISARKRLQLAPESDSSLENDSFIEDKQTVELLAQEFGFTLSEACSILWQFSGNREAARYWIMTDHLLRGHYLWTEEDDKAVLESGADFSHLENLKCQRGEAAVNARRQWLQEDS